MNEASLTYTVNLEFQEVKLPPFRDVLVVAKNARQGKIGLAKSFELLIPNGFEVLEPEDDCVEVVFVHRNVLAKLNKERVLSILSKNVFPFISIGEIIKVDFNIHIAVKNIVFNEEDYENKKAGKTQC